MNLEDIGIKIQKIFNKKKTEKMLAEKGAEKVQETLERIDGEEAYDEATKTAIQEIKKHPELAVKILDTINENVSSRVAVNTVIQMQDVVPESTVVKAAKQLDLEDEHKVAIIEESSLAFENQMKIAEHLEDTETREKVQQEIEEQEKIRCLNELEKLYIKCDENMNEVILENKIKQILDETHIETSFVQDKINKIIGKKIAYNYATYGTNIVSKQRQLMTAQEMNENRIAAIAKTEYQKIWSEKKDIRGVKIKPFKEQELNYNILKEIEATAIIDGFNEDLMFDEIRSMMKTLSIEERKELLMQTKKEIEDKKIRQIKHIIREKGIIEKLVELPEEEATKLVVAFKEVVNNRNEKKQNREER